MRGLGFVLLLLFHGCLLGQTWILEKELQIKDSNYAWTSDEWGQLYQWKDNTISVLNSQTGQSIQESFKSFGRISGLYPLNGLRVLIFSEEQQLLGILDNTLQLNDAFLALYDLNFSSVTHVASSNRPDFIWLFDQYRERLVLFNLRSQQTQQIVDNCFGGKGAATPVQFFEYQQNLICLLSDGRYFEFDRNLTLVKNMNLGTEDQLFEFKNALWLVQDEQLQKLGPTLETIHFNKPDSDFKHLQVLQDRFYFQDGQKIKVFRLNL